MENTPTENKKSFRQNYRLLVCSMLVFFGLCSIGLSGAAFWWLIQRNQAFLANATTTTAAITAEQAPGTEPTQYEMTDQFDDNHHHWITGFEDNDYWSGYRRIEDGVYTWQADEVKKAFLLWTSSSSSKDIKDFDIHVDIKVPNSPSGKICSGIIFRKLERAEDTNDYYYFGFCNNSVARVYFHGGQEGWERLAAIQVLANPSDWNRLEVTARGSHFTFMIHGTLIFEMDDDRLDFGGLGLALELKEQVPALVQFDNFGYQSR